MIGSSSFAFSSWHGELFRMKKNMSGRIEFSDR
jgi:hypothetical protein